MGSLPDDLKAKVSGLVRSTRRQAVKTKIKPRHKLTEEESYSRLDDYIDEARAGAPDDWLSRKTSVAYHTVIRWRKARGLKRPRRQTIDEVGKWALDVFGDAYDAALHSTSSVVLDGLWEVPEYVLRVPLDYDALCRLIWELVVQKYGIKEIAAAIGLKERDVEHALALQAAYLETRGVDCKKCGRVIDPVMGKICKTCVKK